MAKQEDDIQHCALIVSASEQFDNLVKKALPPRDFFGIDMRKSASSGRRYLLERYYDMVIINAPLPEESGMEIAFDVAENSTASVLLVVPKENYGDVMERAAGYGILVLPKPYPKGRLEQSIRFLTATQNKLRHMEHKLQKMEEKMEELRLVTKAKFYLVEQEHITEEEAHRRIGKLAMDSGISRGRAAQRILEE